jgi:hypothetical protein
MGEGGIIFPPLFLHAERYSFCMQEKKNSKTQTMKGKKSYLARRRWCIAGLAASLVVLRWRCHGSRMAAPNSNVTVSNGGERGSCSSILLLFFYCVSFSFCSDLDDVSFQDPTSSSVSIVFP